NDASDSPAPAANDSTAPVASAAPAPSLAPAVPSQRAPSDETPFAGQDLRAGNVIETSAYKFKVRGLSRCADPAANEKVPEDRRVRVAASIEIFSKYDNFFVSGRDVTLEKDGVVINSELDVKPGPGCVPALAQKRLKHDESGAGFVVFQVPDE